MTIKLNYPPPPEPPPRPKAISAELPHCSDAVPFLRTKVNRFGDSVEFVNHEGCRVYSIQDLRDLLAAIDRGEL